MELEELKNDWKIFEAKIEKSKEINDRLIESIIRERSVSRVAKMKIQNAFFLVIMIVEAIAFVAILFGNPFDFVEKWQFLPYGLLLINVFIAMFSMYKWRKNIDFDFGENNISTFLKKMLEYYEKNKVYEKWFGIMSVSIGFLIPLSFLPNKIEKYGLKQGLFDTGIMMVLVSLVFFIAIKMGAFRNRHEEKIKLDLQEYESLKSISAEL